MRSRIFNNRSFSLIELIITIVVLAIVMIPLGLMSSEYMSAIVYSRDAGVSHAKMAADAIESDNISHNNSRTKVLLTFAQVTASTSILFNGRETGGAGDGYPMPRAGCITALYVVNESYTVVGSNYAYASTGNRHFIASNRVGVRCVGSAPNHVYYITVDGVDQTETVSILANGLYITMEIEFDD